MNHFDAFAPWLFESRKNYDLVLFDIDGTLIHGGHPIPGVLSLLDRLRAENFPFLLLTNDANHSRLEKAQILQRCGIQIDPNEIVSSGQPLEAYVAQHHLAGKTAYILGALGNPCYAEAAGLRTTRDLHKAMDADLLIIGESGYDWEPHITTAVNFLRKHPEKPFIVPNPDGFWPGKPGFIGIGAGGVARFITAILEEAHVPVNPFYLGKPFPPIYEFACCYAESFFKRRISFSRTLMVGDNLHSDILGANRAQMPSALVLTGVTSVTQLERASEEYRPSFVFDVIDREF